MELQKVYYEEDYGMGCGYKKVGLRIGDQIVWFASLNYPGKPDELNNFRRMEALIADIVERCGEQAENRENDGVFRNLNHMQACNVATKTLSTTTESTGPYTVRRDVTAGINTKGQPEQHLMWKIKSLLENWDFRAIASELKSEYDQGILLGLVELCEMLTGAKSPRAKTEQPKTDKTCVMCGTREGKYLSTANRWFCEPCTDALPPVNAEGDGNDA